jgi:drug/metabolite transporter (DMT)-like permease
MGAMPPAEGISPRNAGLLALGVLAVSSSAILIRFADAPPLAVSFYRNALAAALLVPLALLRHPGELRSLSRRQWGIALLSGGLLAVHFALWVPSLSYTSVAASTVLVTTGPVWVALIGRVTIGERLTPRGMVGVGTCLLGALVISGGDLGGSGRALFGDALALGGAIAAAGYVLAGRDLRREVSLLSYVGIVYSVAAVLLAAAMLVVGTPFLGYPANVWGLFALMTLVPQILGHTVFNFLLAEVQAQVVAISITAEPIGASLLALAFFGEAPSASVLAGGGLILAGIYVAIAAQTGRFEAAPE